MKYPKFRAIRGRGDFSRFLQEVMAKQRLRGDRALWKDLRPVLDRSSSRGCTFYELHLLYDYIVQHRPRYVLELGAGVSTIVLGHAALRVRQSGLPCTIVSMEESLDYFQDLQNLLPNGLRECLEVVLSPTEDRNVGGRIARCYAKKPKRAYDMVFIDGPQVPKDATFFDGDILDVAAWNPEPFTAFLDARLSTRDSIAALFPSAKMFWDPVHKFTRFDMPEQSLR
jgi:hypothetical protein